MSKNFFVEGPVIPAIIEKDISKHATKLGIGAHVIFLGQVRADIINDKKVRGIEYSAPVELANKKFEEIKEEAITRFQLSCLHIYHSLGFVEAGQLSLYVLSSSPHRKAALDSLEWIVEKIKKEVPIFGKEIFDDGNYVWKKNTE
ncbi:MAG TPA: molybdenum cofactor biosynthesis protein MoaE [Bacteroidia bacterium]|nr:molybdenum cofactor biosynthesis protein MoaE [Bacteroidia bacterium]